MHMLYRSIGTPFILSSGLCYEGQVIKIFVTMKTGEALMPEVLKGIVSQSVECCIIPVTNKGVSGFSENHRRLNVVEAMSLNDEDYFILMDCDVVINSPTLISEMMDDKANWGREIVNIFTKENEDIKTCPYVPHALMLVKGFKMREFKEYMKNTVADGEGKEFCLICRWFNLNKNMDSIITLQNRGMREVPRIDLTKEFVAYG
jgi:hypothetical protein